jgi:GNAT superfamily N-acetyltransferase
MEIRHTDGADGDFILLCRELDEFLNDAAGGAEHRAAYILHNELSGIHDVFIAYEKGRPAGCASFKAYAMGTAEVKRVFVRSAYRGRKIGETLMRALEEEARRQGYGRLVLETGDPLVAATGLYKKTGYRFIENYGPYADMPKARCMGKEIKP